MLVEVIDDSKFVEEIKNQGYNITLISKKHETTPSGSYIRFLYDLEWKWETFWDLDQLFQIVEKHKNVTIVRL